MMNYVWLTLLIVAVILLILKIKEFYFTKSVSVPPTLKAAPVLETKIVKQGLQVDKLKEGTGPGASSGKHVTVHYRAFLQDGTEVDSSYAKGGPFEFTMGRNQVIPGWEMGMKGMKVGEVSRFVIAPEHAYGDKGKGKVPPNAEIIFEVTLLKMS